MFLRLCQGNKGTEIDMIKGFRPPLKNNLVTDEEREEEELDPKIHCIEDASHFPHLTQSVYEESLMNRKRNELSKGDKSHHIGSNKYNLRSKKKEEKFDQPLIEGKPAKPTTNTA
jgi:hypothetical protein